MPESVAWIRGALERLQHIRNTLREAGASRSPEARRGRQIARTEALALYDEVRPRYVRALSDGRLQRATGTGIVRERAFGEPASAVEVRMFAESLSGVCEGLRERAVSPGSRLARRMSATERAIERAVLAEDITLALARALCTNSHSTTTHSAFPSKATRGEWA